MEEDADDLRRPDEGRRPSRRQLERLQREPGAVQHRQVRACGSTPRSRPPSSPIRRSPRSPTRSASRWRRTRASARTPTGCGPGRSPFPPARRRPTRPRSSSPGRPEGLHRARRREGRLGQRAARHAHVALRESRVPEGRAVREADARHRSTPPIRTSRRSSRCPMSACSSSPSPSSRASAPRSASSSRRRSPVHRRSTRRSPRRKRRPSAR